MMTCGVDIADYHWLTGAEAAAILADLAGRDEPVHVAAERLRKSQPASRAHLLLEQVELRRRAAVKFERATAMFFTRVGLEQSTDEWVAAHKAGRFAALANGQSVADLCCGIGGDLLALGSQFPSVGVDRDPISTCLAAINAEVHGLSERVSLQATEVETLDATQFSAWHLDPDRRPSGRRTTALEWSSPSLEIVDSLLAANSNAAIKLAPAADVPADWSDRCELEWISRDRECRQLVAWHGKLAQSPGRRTATALSADGATSATHAGEPNQDFEVAPLGQFLFDPDAAVLAAHLGGSLAAELGLYAISRGIAYLTGQNPIDSPLLGCFAVDEVMPLDLRKIADALRRRRVGRLEIKKRGVDHDPESVRKKLNLHGDDSAVLILTKLTGKHTAIVAHRVLSPGLSLSPVI